MNKRSVYKFGGSSVRDAEAIERCCQLVLKNSPSAEAVVVSATYNTTNQLESLFHSIGNSDQDEFESFLDKIVEKHLLILDGLKLSSQKNLFLGFLSPLLDRLKLLFHQNDTSARSLDEFYSLGELMSSWIFHTRLSTMLDTCVWVDAREWLKTDSTYGHASPDVGEIVKYVRELETHTFGCWVTQGFIGSSLEGPVTTLGREGSDYSATLLGEALEVEEVVIWTDVNGIYSADPRIVKHAQKISHLSYDQAEILAESGAKVLYSRTLSPAKRSGFCVRVASSFTQELDGTIIDTKESQDFFAVTKKNYDHSHEIVSVFFPSKMFPSFQGLIHDFKEIERTSSLWQGLVPVSVSDPITQDIHAALLNSKE